MSDQFGINSVTPDPDNNPYKGMEFEDRPVPGEPGRTVRVYFPKGRPQPVEQEPEPRWQSPSVFYSNLVSEWKRQWGTPVAPQQMTIQERFERYHKQNPQVYELLVARARRLKAEGRTKIGIGMLTEQFRWNDDPLLSGGEGFKISNDYRSRYARLIMAQEPDLAGMFETRELTSL